MTARYCVNLSDKRDYPRARKRDRAYARQILVMVCHERVAKREQHDESQHRAKSGDEKCGRDFNAASDVSPEEVDGHARRDSREQRDIVEPIQR